MATTLQQLLDNLTERASARPGAAAIEDVTGALAHLGRALTGLADDGLTPGNSSRQRNATALAVACTTAGQLWPHSGGPLADLAGAAADLTGRDRDAMGRSHRWAVTTELAEAADTCSLLGRRLLPWAAAPELDVVRQSATAIEREAQTEPPTAAGSAVLDRLVPLPGPPSGQAEVTGLDAAAGLLAALDRARRADDLTLREFRAAVAAAELTSRYAAIAAGRAGQDTGPLLVAGLAWHLAGRASMVFHDGRRGAPGDSGGVVMSAQALVRALRTKIDTHADTGGRRDQRTPADVVAAVRQIAGQMPVLADRLTVAIDRWSRTGRLYANARDLPPMEDMPENRVTAVIIGRPVQTHGADLDHLRQVVAQAADLSTGLADAPQLAARTGPPEQQAERPGRKTQVPGVAGRLLHHAHAVDRDISVIRSSPPAGREVPPAR